MGRNRTISLLVDTLEHTFRHSSGNRKPTLRRRRCPRPVQTSQSHASRLLQYLKHVADAALVRFHPKFAPIRRRAWRTAHNTGREIHGVFSLTMVISECQSV